MRFFPKTLDPDVVLAHEGNESPTEKTLDREAAVGAQHEKKWAHEPTVVQNSEAQHDAIDSQVISPEAQYGVQKIEATTLAWSKRDLILAYIMIMVINFIDAMQQGTTGLLTPYVYSDFSLHSLTATAGILSGLIGGLVKLPLAKVIDIWGRPQGFIIMVGFQTIGLIMMAACNNVETYCAAQVFYWIGYNGTSYVLGIFVADTSSLRNRGLMFAVTSCQYIVTVWITGPLAEAFLDPLTLEGPGWRWCFGAFSIITPVIHAPLFALFVWNYRKAKKSGLMPARPDSGRTKAQSLWYYVVQFDLFGILLACAGLSLFLLPFSLYYYQSNGWKSAMIICMIIFGVLFMIAFAVWERFFAPVTFMPYELLKDRTVAGACLLSAVLFIEFYIWDSYFSSFLQVVNNLDLTRTGWIVNIYSVGACFWAIVAGYWIRVTGKFKAISLYFGVPITILGIALMIAFRKPDVNIGYIVMCQIFIAFGGGTLVIGEQIAVMAATSHQYIAVVLAVEGMFTSIGGAIGSTVAGAIWTGTFPDRLMRYLPEDSIADFDMIYGDLTTQISYEVGSPTRIAISRAYADAQRIMLIASSVVLVLAILGVAIWRDINVKNFKQVKGTVA